MAKASQRPSGKAQRKPGSAQASQPSRRPVLGLYRTELTDFGECVRLHPDAGDSAPYLPREIYGALDFHPSFDELPSQDEYESRHAASEQPGWS